MVMENKQLTRRDFLKFGAASLVLQAAPFSLFSADVSAEIFRSQPGQENNSSKVKFWDKPRELWIKRASTGETLRTCYWKDGSMDRGGYIEACKLLRDVHADSAVQMDIGLLNLMRGIQGWLELWDIKQPIVVNSGYRTSRTNNSLEGAARNSMHLYGKAADIWIPGLSTEYLGRLTKEFGAGGVGFYRSKGFIHIDTGDRREWRG